MIPMNVLSCFDGMSCGQLALRRAGVSYDNYFASELDKYAIKVTQCNFPETVQLGDVQEVRPEKLPKIDLLIGGSPCQGFSFVGKRLNFDDPRSKLFLEYVRLLEECKPKCFFLENVRMDKTSQEAISEALNCEPILFNSKLVCAQSRTRLYWTNIAAKPDGLFGRVKFWGYIPTKDRGIALQDITQDSVDKSYCVKGKQYNMAIDEARQKKKFVQIDGEKGLCLMARSYSNWNGDYISSGEQIRTLTEIECERLQGLPDNYTKSASKTQRYKMLGNGWQADTIKIFFKYLKPLTT